MNTQPALVPLLAASSWSRTTAAPQWPAGSGGGAPAGGGETAAATASHAPIIPRRNPALRHDASVLITAALLQLIIFVAQWSKATTLGNKLVPAAFVLGFCIPLAFMLLRPREYLRCRDWLLPAVLAAMVAAPSYRRIDSGLGLLLHRPPQPGSLGAVGDALRAAAGMRALGACLLACFFVFPPLPAILSSAFGTAISWNPDYCATPLMTSALVRERLGVLASWLEVASWPMAAFQPVAGALPAPLPEDSHALCLATAAWWHATVGLIIPVIIQAWLWRPLPREREEQQRASVPDDSGARGGLWRRLSNGVDAANRGLHLAFGGTDGVPFPRPVLAYYLLANCWLLTKA